MLVIPDGPPKTDCSDVVFCPVFVYMYAYEIYMHVSDALVVA